MDDRPVCPYCGKEWRVDDLYSANEEGYLTGAYTCHEYHGGCGKEFNVETYTLYETQESFTDWITGEYDRYLEPALRCAGCGSIVEWGEPCDNCMIRSEPITEDYEVPHHGLLDEPSVIETAINARLIKNRKGGEPCE
jgi:hypothetical protein